MVNIKVLASVLARANASPPSHGPLRDAFYEVKEEILRRWGHRTGTIVQHIVKPCWGWPCDGCHDDCTKCGGTGIYSESWIKLEVWTLMGREFHRPVARLRRFLPRREVATIEGVIQKRPARRAAVCRNALFCLFRPAMLCSSLQHWDGEHCCAESFRRAMRVAACIGTMPRYSIKLPSAEPPF